MPHGKRKYLPYHLSTLEKHDPMLRHKLSRMIEKLEEKYCKPHKKAHKGNKYDYRFCDLNPVAVARSALEHKHKNKYL